MIDRVAADLGRHAARGAGRLQVVRARACSTAPSASAARSPRARRSCAATARSGRPTRTASCSRCSPRRSSRSPGKTPSEHYATLTGALRRPGVRPHRRAGHPRAEGRARQRSRRSRSRATELAGEPITAKLTEAPGNGAPIGGLKVTTENAWFAARPVRHRGRLQGLRRELPWAGAPGPGAGRGPRGRLSRPRAPDASALRATCHPPLSQPPPPRDQAVLAPVRGGPKVLDHEGGLGGGGTTGGINILPTPVEMVWTIHSIGPLGSHHSHTLAKVSATTTWAR